MRRALEIGPDLIEKLDQSDCVQLLGRLLRAEASSSGLPLSGVDVPLQISVADGGEDGRIAWAQGPDRTDYLPARLVVFQVKAANLAPAKCRNEVLGKDNKLKPRIRDALLARGAYIMFCNHPIVRRAKDARIEAIRDAITKSGESGNAATVDYYDGNQIAAWVNSHPAVAAWLLELNGLGGLNRLETWNAWESRPNMAKYRYVRDQETDAEIAKIRDLFRERGTCRLLGMSGLGKTRLVLETFRPPSDPSDLAQRVLSERVLYVRVREQERTSILDCARLLMERGSDAILVVDECDATLHRDLLQVVDREGGRVGLLTIDFAARSHGEESRITVLRPRSAAVIEEILRQAFGRLESLDTRRIVEFSQGYPQIAVLLGNARIDGDENRAALRDDELLERMLWQRDPRTESADRAIRTCSLFNTLGMEGKFSNERDFVATRLCNVTSLVFGRHIAEFEARGVILRRGDFVRVEPLPLALRLAADEWTRLSVGDIRTLFAEMPPRLSEALCDQIGRLEFSDRARALVQELCGEKGPFRDRAVLNTAIGSRCFRPLAEANPAAALQALEVAFGTCTREELLTVGSGRRNLVWALEKLAFRRDLFARAGRLLLNFALAETENWGNNATGQFIQLFQTYLAGTEATGSDRLKLLDESLETGDKLTLRLCVNALARAVSTSPAHRMGGAETQGSGTILSDWDPGYDEAADYWRGTLRRLAKLGEASDETGEAAKEEIVKSCGGLIAHGLVDEVGTVLETLKIGVGALRGIAETLEFRSDGMLPAYRERVVALYDRLFPSSLPDRVLLLVRDAPHVPARDAKERGDGRWQAMDKVVRALAEETSRGRVPDELVAPLSRGSQHMTFVYAKRVAELTVVPRELVESAFEALRDAGAQGNGSFACGVLAGLELRRRDVVDEALDAAARDPQLVPWLPDLTASVEIHEPDVRRVEMAVRSKALAPTRVRAFMFGGVLKRLSPALVAALVDSLIDAGTEGADVATALIRAYSFEATDRLVALHAQLKRLLCLEGVFDRSTADVRWEHDFEELVEWWFEHEPNDEEVAARLTGELIRDCGRDDLRNRPFDVKQAVARLLLTKNAKVAWPKVSAAIVTGGALVRYRWSALLGAKEFAGRNIEAAVLAIGVDGLLEWCRRNVERAPAFLVGCVKLIEQNANGEYAWTPLVGAILAEFGDREDVQSAVHASMHTFPWRGSRVPYYQRYVGLLEQLIARGPSRLGDWAAKALAGIQFDIGSERKSDEEEEFGIYR